MVKGINWLPADYIEANAVISSWNGMVLERAADRIFGDEKVAMFLPLFNETKFIWDEFSNTNDIQIKRLDLKNSRIFSKYV